VPAGLVEPVTFGFTVAVKSTGWLTFDGDGAAISEVVVADPATFCVATPEPVRKFLSPEYAAVIV
jgi:hypothetical protein